MGQHTRQHTRQHTPHALPTLSTKPPLSTHVSSLQMVLAESTLHHVADGTLYLMREMVRVTRSHVMIVEDVLERSASRDVRWAYQRHDELAVYRSLAEWLGLSALRNNHRGSQ